MLGRPRFPASQTIRGLSELRAVRVQYVSLEEFAQLMEQRIFWNEAYLRQACLAFSSAFEVLWSSSYLRHRHPQVLHQSLDSCKFGEDTCSSLWMRRVR